MITNNSELKESEKWLADVPHDTRQLIVKKLLDNFKTAIKNFKNRNIKSFKLKYLSKKDRRQYFFVDYRSLKNNGYLWPNKLNHPLKMKKIDLKWLNKLRAKNKLHQMIITREYPGKYYLHVPHEKIKEKTKPKKSIVAIDPGVRSFHSFYDPEGTYGEIGTGLAKELIKTYNKVDHYQSIIAKSTTTLNNKGYKWNHKKRQKLRKRSAKLRTKVRHIIDDYHRKSILYYCRNYKTIIIPKLNTNSIKKRIKRNNLPINKIMIRRMMILAHNRCIDRLKYKASLYDAKVIVVTEEYTSKTCGKCGIIKENLGLTKIYKCGHCGIIIDRDINGARNILIKNYKKWGKMRAPK